MSAVTAPAGTRRALKVTQGRVLRSEWTKLRSVRSTGYTLLLEGTVKIHVGRILAKLGLRDRVQAVVLAYESGLITPGN
jgi:hypothetical protein